MTTQQALDLLDHGGTLTVRCPDGTDREVWGYNGGTGDLFVVGWPGDVFMDCTDGTLRAEFDPPRP